MAWAMRYEKYRNGVEIIMKAYVCNKCNTAITDKTELANTMKLTWSTDIVGYVETYHLCEECKTKFFEFLVCESEDGSE
jgi:hypothetical protein